MSVYKNIKISTKLILSFGIMVLLVCVTGIFGGYKTVQETNTQYIAMYDNYGDPLPNLAIISTDFQQECNEIRAMFFGKDQEEIEALEAQANSTAEGRKKAMDDFSKAIVDDDIRALYSKLEVALKDFDSVTLEVKTLVKAGDPAAASATLGSKGLPVAAIADTAIHELFDTFSAKANAESIRLSTRAEVSANVVLGATLFAIAFAVIICVLTIRSVVKPINKLCGVAKKLSIGSIDVSVKRESKDEIGDLMEAFSLIIDSIKYQANFLQELSSGNLRLNVTTRSAEDVIGNSMKNIIQAQNSSLNNIKESSFQVTTGSQQVAMASQSLAQGSTEQASAIQQITASINEIAERTRVNAADANETNSLVKDAKEEAVKGNEQMHEMIQAMDAINDSSENISKIIKVIDDIAFQTNILALNAAVEAARAGQHGKGFAVVAEEVRSLAGKSAAAASETAEMIEDSIKKVARGSKLAEETAKELEYIVVAVDKIVELISRMAIASNDQATAVTQIDQAIGQVSQVVQTNSATSEECAAASEELSNQAVKLRELIANYKLKDTGFSQRQVEFHQQEREYLEYSDNNNVISLEGDYGKY